MAAVKKLRELRQERNTHVDPLEILALSRPLISSGAINKAGDDTWDIYEQTIIAALEVSEDNLALECLTRLSDKFPSSGRVHALRGMMLEATQDPSEAIKFYDKVLKVEPTNVPIMKRRITFNKSLGRVGEAISYLVAYLDVYYTDPDAWAELAELYTAISQHEQAAYCWSEAILLAPHDHLAHASYADALYSQSQEQQTETALIYAALKEYLRSVELCDDYLHGFCGIRTCCKIILAQTPSSKDTKALARKQQLDDVNGIDECRIPRQKVEALDLMSLKVLTKLSKDAKLENVHGQGVRALVQSLIV